jgi:hypothetical protein
VWGHEWIELEMNILEELKVAPVIEKMRSNRLSWYGHGMWRDESHITKRVMSINVDGYSRKGRPKKRWIDCVMDDMRIKRVSMEMTSDRRGWKKKACCADPT